MTTLLEAHDLTVWRGETLLLDALTLQVNAGELLQIQGANGSGKTTLLRVLAGLVPADEGEVFWRGEPMHRARDQFQSDLLYVGHKSGVCGALTPVENLRLVCRLNGADPVRIESSLAQLALGDRMHVRCQLLSAGQQRRVALTRLLLQRAALWILDEPLTALDVAGLDWVGERIREQIDRGGAVLLTTHQPVPLDAARGRTLVLQ